MKSITIILTFLSFMLPGRAQKRHTLIFPDSARKSQLYFSPVLPYSTIPRVCGLKRIDEPYDSLKYIEPPLLYPEEEDTTKSIEENNKWLTLLVDTSQEIDISERFTESTKDYNWHSTPRKFKTISGSGKVKTILCNKDTELVFKGYPVSIGNYSNYGKSIFIKEFGIEIVQEAKDKAGNWKPIEISMVFMCGMGFYTKVLKPGEEIITSVFKYKGNYKTLLRLKLISRNHIIYSKPFRGSINYAQFDLQKIHYIDWIPYEK